MDIGPLTPASPRPLDPGRPSAKTDDASLRQAASAFEATFLAEMLKQSGLNAMPAGFGGGAGEEAFASFLTDEYARLLASRGGLGLAEQIYRSLAETRGDPA